MFELSIEFVSLNLKNASGLAVRPQRVLGSSDVFIVLEQPEILSDRQSIEILVCSHVLLIFESCFFNFCSREILQ